MIKKLIALCLFATLPASFLYGQYSRPDILWVNLGAGSGIGTSRIANRNSLKDENININTLNGTNNFGLRLGFTLYEKINIGLEAGTSSYEQIYDISNPDNYYSYTKELNLKSLDFSALARFTNFYGLYFELGPKFLLLRSANASFKGSFPTSVESDQYDRYSSLSMHILSGAGVKLVESLHKNVVVSAGVRTSFQLDDLMNQTTDNAALDWEAYQPVYNTALPTHLFALHFRIEIVYQLGYIGQTASGPTRFIWFP